ncbi:nose resistant to fluoxetine protein 6 [Rhipicephalus microplus]|uniref:nose resistant to fluoxetine protein 6 n=1 Tax=Rhipicephalus microplus TaxID=6941 RepID=UPI003F6C18CF
MATIAFRTQPKTVNFQRWHAQLLALFYVVLFSEATLSTPKRSHMVEDLHEEFLSAELPLSARCRHDVSVYMTHLQSGSDWAMKMFDSTGKMESGIMKGGRTFLGLYSECIEALPQATTLSPSEDHTQHLPAFMSTYCLTTMRLHSKQKDEKQGIVSSICKKLSGSGITAGVCVPSTCTEEDVSAIATFAMCGFGCNGNATSTRCRRESMTLMADSPALVTTICLVLLTLVVIAATIMDYNGRRHVKKEAMKSSATEKDSVSAATGKTNQEGSFGPKTRKALLCFSLLENGARLFGSEISMAGSLTVLNGLRFFSIAWIVCIHNRYISRDIAVFRNSHELYKNHLTTTIIDRGTLAVDTFLFVGGLLVGYANLTYLKKVNGQKNWLIYYFHRYLRTAPLMMITVAVSAFLMHYMGDGPLWMDIITTYESTCRDNWWMNLINIQNFINTKKACLPHTWYSAVDFQLYCIAPIFIYLLYRWPRVGKMVCGVLVVASASFTTVYTAVHGLGSVPGVYDYMEDVYIKPYFRISTYLAGILLGNYIVANKESISATKCNGRLGWLCSIICLLFAIFGLRIMNPSLESPLRGAFNASAPTVWCLGLAWIVYSSMAGCGGPVTKFLSCSVFAPLSKLVFAVYLTHQPLQYLFYASRQESFDYNYFLMGYFFVGNLALAFAVAALLTLVIEMPMCNLEKLVLGRG